MIIEADALARVLAQIRPLRLREVDVADALNAFAAEDVSASLSLPPFDNSAMDGYAVVAESCRRGERLRVIGEQPAGAKRELTVAAGEAVRIFTGAPMPSGADAVVMQEDVEADGATIVLQTDVAPGEFVRRRGGDVAAGQKILAAGTRVTPQTIGLLAAQGIPRLRVGGEATAAVITTGDELKPVGVQLQPGEIHESNGPLLRALLQSLHVKVRAVEHCPDDHHQIEAAIRSAASCDIMILSGGVSVGARDLVKPALAKVGAQLDVWRVAVKPGKPFLFGRLGHCAVFGLPGNPVSAFVTFLLFVRPAILQLKGASELQLRQNHARLAEPLANAGDRPHYIRGSLGRDGVFRTSGRQESHALFGLSRANALLRLAPEQQIAAGESVSVFMCE